MYEGLMKAEIKRKQEMRLLIARW